MDEFRKHGSEVPLLPPTLYLLPPTPQIRALHTIIRYAPMPLCPCALISTINIYISICSFKLTTLHFTILTNFITHLSDQFLAIPPFCQLLFSFLCQSYLITELQLNSIIMKLSDWCALSFGNLAWKAIR